jgi:hypothetical protein
MRFPFLSISGLLGASLPVLMSVGTENFVAPALAQKPGEGKLTLIVTDGPEGKPVPVRMHLKNQQKVARKALGAPFWFDHFVFPGQIALTLNKGNYTFVIERGPEYTDQSGHFEMQGFAKDTKTVAMRRAVNMAEADWWSADLHIHRSAKEIELLMQAEDLHVAPLVSWTNEKNEWAGGKLPKSPLVKFDGDRYYDQLAGEDHRAGGRLLFFNLPEPYELPNAETKSLAQSDLLERMHGVEGAWIDAPSANAWDLPIWLSRGVIDSIGVASDRIGRSGLGRKEKDDGRPSLVARKIGRESGVHDFAGWSQEIYFNVLNTGLQIPPSAGSGSGEALNPLGYNRLYVRVDHDNFDYTTFWRAFRRGRVTVTNGPLLQPQANGRPPGQVFKLEAGERLEVDVAMNMTVRENVSYMQLIHNGRVAQSIRLEDWAKTGHFPPLVIDQPGWFLVRVGTDQVETPRFAITGPWYVAAVDGSTHISRAAVQFFLDWLDERAKDFGEDSSSRKFWEERLTKANAD